MSTQGRQKRKVLPARSLENWLIPLLICGLLGLFSFSRTRTLLAKGPAHKNEVQVEGISELRKKFAWKKRRIIFNNDGDDAYPFKTYNSLVKEFIRARTTGLIGSQVDTIFYSTACSFGYFSHRTNVGYTFLTGVFTSLGLNRYNIVPDLVGLGTDPLKLMVDSCRKYRIEIFWSLRMNDTHDSGTEDYAKYYFSPWKKLFPELLAGSPEKKPLHGGWSAVDYAQPAVQNAVFEFCKEVCRNYEIDGLELDFCRHPHFFKNVAWGIKITQAELDMMTALVRRIRKMADAESVKKGRPILIAVRVPDSLKYCHDIGIDLNRWLHEGLIDILTTGEIFQLMPWKYSADLGHKYGIPVYACLAGSRVKGESHDLPASMLRNSAESYRGLAMQAWQSGVDGIYLFNFNYSFKPYSVLWWELGDPQTMLTENKTYFVSPLGKGRAGYLLEALAYIRLPVVSPDAPLRVGAGAEELLPIILGEDISEAEKHGFGADVQCVIWVKDLGCPLALRVELNGHLLTDGLLDGELLKYHVTPSFLKKGENVFRVAYRPKGMASRDCTKGGGQQIPSGSSSNVGSICLYDVLLSVAYEKKLDGSRTVQTEKEGFSINVR